MNLEEAKEILEGIGLLETVTPELTEAASMVLDRLEETEDRLERTEGVPVPQHISQPFPDYRENCDCSMCAAYRQRWGTEPPTLVREVTISSPANLNAQCAGHYLPTNQGIPATSTPLEELPAFFTNEIDDDEDF